MRALRGGVAAIVALATIGITGGAVGRPPGHDIVYLASENARPDGSLLPNTGGYVAVESSTAFITIQRYQHGFQPGEVDYTTLDIGTASPGSDYTTTTGTRTLNEGIDSVEVAVPILGDTSEEGPETFDFRLVRASGGMVPASPRQATVTIIDDDGPARISFAAASYSLFEREDIELVVIRQGDASGAASGQLNTADGTATSPDDYTAQSAVPVTFNTGQRVKRVTIPVTNDTQDEEAEDFSATLSGETGAALVSPSSVTIELLDDDSPSSDRVPPVSAFHIPRDGKTYGPRSAVRDQIHISPSDGGSGVADVHLALRKKMRNGDCKWWTGRGFRSGSCARKRWLDLSYKQVCFEPNAPFCIYELRKELKLTTRKTGIKNYTAWARAEDNAGNLETSFRAGRNKSTYKIKP